MGKFKCDFDALEIEAHQIISDGQGIAETHRYEPVGIKEGDLADVWSVFGHTPIIPGNIEDVMSGGGGGRELIADCETAEGAEFIAGLVARHIRQQREMPINPGYTGFAVPIYWYTDKPKGVKA